MYALPNWFTAYHRRPQHDPYQQTEPGGLAAYQARTQDYPWAPQDQEQYAPPPADDRQQQQTTAYRDPAQEPAEPVEDEEQRFTGLAAMRGRY